MARSAAAFTVTAVTVLAAAACGGSPSGHVAQVGSTATRTSTAPASSSAVAFSSCMRANGVASFPDPDATGALPKVNLQQLGVSASRFASADHTCAHLLPTSDVETSVTECLSTGACPQPLLHEIMTEGLTFARCMRADGVTNFPDPTRDRLDGAPVFDLFALHGTDWRSPQIDRKLDACMHVYSEGVRVGLHR